MTGNLKLAQLFGDMLAFLRAHTLAILPFLIVMLVLLAAVDAALVSTIGDSAATVVSMFTTILISAPFGVFIYRRGLGVEAKEGWVTASWGLALGQCLIYLFFGIVGVLAAMFLALLAGILAGAGGFEPSGEAFDSEQLGAAAAALEGGGQIVLAALVLATVFVFIWLGARLVLFGIATTAETQIMVFRTWGWTQGHALKITVFCVAIYLPVIITALGGLNLITGGSMAYPLTETAQAKGFELVFSGFISLITFLIGHAAAIAIYRQLAPAAQDYKDAFA